MAEIILITMLLRSLGFRAVNTEGLPLPHSHCLPASLPLLGGGELRGSTLSFPKFPHNFKI